MVTFFVRSVWLEYVSVNRSILSIFGSILDFCVLAVTCINRILCSNGSEAVGEFCYNLSSVVLLPDVALWQDVGSYRF